MFSPDEREHLHRLFSELQTIYVQLLVNTQSAISLQNWFALFTNADGEPISVYEQEDAHEYLTRFVDTVDKCLIFTSSPFLIRDLFEGEMNDQLICPNCGVIRDKKVAYSNLSVEVGSGDLLSALREVNATEVIEDFNCERCGQRVNVTKSTHILSFPKYLIVQAKFFSFDYYSFRKVKLNQPFTAPMTVDLKELQSGAEACSEYKLKGVVYHIGVADSGHYYSVVRDVESQKWFEMNDEVVSERSEEEVERNCEVEGCERMSAVPSIVLHDP